MDTIIKYISFHITIIIIIIIIIGIVCPILVGILACYPIYYDMS